ncbi:hypothetical protein FK535_15010 [Mycolicibacterium sp. 018/SC-01/001]|uniref:hypothetical protein n=1 Tax=Mycolicibacterium sp. 018/SC-01/001 TaxID=2592069 RepID=UPI001180A2CB|nr:hypothetical protein [Mycolicibacterium sp. 018/SC-01/001]TRW81667.1 hypothetical protein FK535_15010 [Mycolicibacterium sp. 018/SC-01/001]
MADSVDVPGRLAQGLPAATTLSEYVWAAHQVGYVDPDLTLHPGQVRDWYGTEDGMDLAVLQRDCVALDAAARVTREAMAIQEDLAGTLSNAWRGSGAHAAWQFLSRHRVASAAVADALDAAAAALQRTLDQVWRAVDTKVDVTVGVDADVGAAREHWLAAATTVTSGAGDRVAAAELVDTAVKPFVQNRIGGEWLSAVQASGAAVAEAYRTAAAQINGRAPAEFEIPGALGPVAAPPPVAPTVTAGWEAPAAASVSAGVPAPAGASVGPAVPAPAAPSPLAPTPVAPSALAPPADAVAPPSAPPLAPMPAGAPMSDLGGGGLSGIGQRFADALSGLLGGGASGDATDSPADIEPPQLPEPDEEEDEPEEDEPDDEEELTEDEDAEGEPDAEEIVTEQVPEPGPESGHEPQPAPEPAPTPPPPPAEPLPPLPPPTGERTPCEIAADEIPQVGPPPATGPGGG